MGLQDRDYYHEKRDTEPPKQLQNLKFFKKKRFNFIHYLIVSIIVLVAFHFSFEYILTHYIQSGRH